MDANQTNSICGFWKRILALIIDYVILGIIGLLMGLFFSEQFVVIGNYGRIIGFIIILLYFGILNSALGKGRSLGKKILHIKVVDKDGKYISVNKSLLRAAIFALPFILNGLMLPMSNFIQFFTILQTVIIFGMGISIFYLYIFNRNTRQSLHDLICGTYVIRDDAEEVIYQNPVSKVHYAIVSILMICSLILPFVINSFVFKSDFFKRLYNLQNQISMSSNITYSTINEGVSYHNGSKSSYISVNIVIKNKDLSEETAKKIAKIILNLDSYKNEDIVSIITTYGYDIGICSSYLRKKYNHSPGEWRTILKK